MLKGDGQKMVTGRFSQGQFHVVSEAEFGIGIWDWQDMARSPRKPQGIVIQLESRRWLDF